MSRHAAQMADIGAVNSTAFVFGMAAIDNELIEDISRYDASVGVETYKQYLQIYMSVFSETFRAHLSGQVVRDKDRDVMIIQGVQNMTSLLSHKVTENYNATHLQNEINRMRHVSAVEEQQGNMEMDLHDATWDLDLYSYGGNMLATAGGAVVTPAKMTRTQSVLSGTVTGAATGYAMGGPIGAGIGAVAGFMYGILS